MKTTQTNTTFGMFSQAVETGVRSTVPIITKSRAASMAYLTFYSEHDSSLINYYTCAVNVSTLIRRVYLSTPLAHSAVVALVWTLGP